MSTFTTEGLTFTINDPYSEGHPLTHVEAQNLNALRATNIKQNFRKIIIERLKAWHAANPSGPEEAKKEVPQTLLSQIQSELEQYAQNYEFKSPDARGSRGRPSQHAPAETLARKMVKPIVLDLMKAKGHDPRAYDREQIDALLGQYLDKNPHFREAAQRQLDELKKLSAAALSAGTI